LDWDSLLGELLDEVFIASELLIDLLGEGGVFGGVFASSLTDGCQILPIDGVVDMPTEVELDGLAERSQFVVVEVLLCF